MSLFSFFTTLLSFVSRVWASLKSEWQNLIPEIKADIEAVIQFGNLIKNYLLTPGLAGPVGGDLITILENALGPQMVSAILAIIVEVVFDLNIIDESITDPLAAFQALLSHIFSLKTTGRGIVIFELVCGIIGKIITYLNNNQIKATVAFVYDNFYSVPTVAA